MRLVLAIVAVSLIGCASHRVPDHSLLYTPDREHNIWSYEPVVGEGFVSRPMQPNQPVKLRNGAIVSFDGRSVVVTGKAINSANAVVQCDGKVREGAFIRTFE